MNYEEFKAAVSKIGFGKKLPDAIYLHKCGLEEAPAELHQFISRIATALKIPEEEWELVKLFRRDFKLSFLAYPEFNTNPYPPLHSSINIDLSSKKVRSASYADSGNPPILHRRELFIPPNDPRKSDFLGYTREGEELELYTNTSKIGTREGWLRTIRKSGHRLDENNHIVPLELSQQGAENGDLSDPEAIQRHKTAIARDKLSVPMFTLARLGYISGEYSILDYGCGKGDDLRELEAHEIDCIGWDPVFMPDTELEPCDIVNLGYVINVIEDIEERRKTLNQAFNLTNQLLVVSAMLGNESIYERFKPYKDGVITKTNTFQKYYFQSELKQFIETSLQTEAIAAGPGLFLVFQDKVEEQRYLSERQRTRINWRQLYTREKEVTSPKISKSKIDKNKPLLEDFWYTCLDLGRPAALDEFEHSESLRHLFGSHSKALSLCSELYDPSQLDNAERKRRDDILVYLALDHFGKRDAYQRMPSGLQQDIKYHFGKYSDAREEASELLFSVSDIEVIRSACIEAHKTISASALDEEHDLVFHKQYLNECPKALRVYIGCAVQMYGDIGGIDLIKAHILSGKVTLMIYDGFETDAIPLLKERIKIKLREQEIDFFDYVFQYRPQPLLWRSKVLPVDHSQLKEQQEFDQKLAKLLSLKENELHVSADRLDLMIQESNLKIEGFKIQHR